MGVNCDELAFLLHNLHALKNGVTAQLKAPSSTFQSRYDWQYCFQGQLAAQLGCFQLRQFSAGRAVPSKDTSAASTQEYCTTKGAHTGSARLEIQVCVTTTGPEKTSRNGVRGDRNNEARHRDHKMPHRHKSIARQGDCPAADNIARFLRRRSGHFLPTPKGLPPN
jgi:hypothetical protein